MEEKRDIRKYILEFHKQFTRTEIADKFGLSGPRIDLLCAELGVKCITKGERHKQFMRENPSYSKEEFSEILGIGARVIRLYARQIKQESPSDVAEPQAANEAHPSYTFEEEENLLHIAAIVFDGLSDEQKKKFREKYVFRHRIPGVIRSDYL